MGISAAACALAAIFAAAGLQAQSIPPTQPTSLPINNSMPAPIAATTTTTAAQPAKRPNPAQVSYFDGKINIRANDSSLNQILRAIARMTGLKITGGVQDERVFGNYGPAPLSSVLATLLDGTGTNILFLAGNPPQLNLTPRGGGATPPNPDSAAYAAFDNEGPAKTQPAQGNLSQPPSPQAPVTTSPASIAQPLNNVNGSSSNTSPTASTLPTTHSVSLDSVPTPSTTPSTSGIVDAPNPPAPGSTTGTAPAGSLTPEQVYQQLLKQQKQQQSNPPPTNSTPQH